MAREEPPNLELVIKLAKMTTSSTDPEALSAVRMLNAQLTKYGWDWERLLRGRVTVVADPFATIPTPPARPTPPPPEDSWTRPTKARWKPTPPPPPPPPPRPSPPPPSPSPICTVPNRYAANCYGCGVFVTDNKGLIFKKDPSRARWEVACLPCATRFNRGGINSIPSTRAKAQKSAIDDVWDAIKTGTHKGPLP